MNERYKRIVQRYFTKDIYSVADVATFVIAGKITAEDYKDITGEDYPVE